MMYRTLRWFLVGCAALFGPLLLSATAANAAAVMALGASNTFGKAVAHSQAYPAQREAILRARGSSVHIVNAGINGDPTEAMLRRLDRAAPNGVGAVILQPGGNDRRKRSPDRTADIESRLPARHIPVIMLSNGMLHGLPHLPDGQHLTPGDTGRSRNRWCPRSRARSGTQAAFKTDPGGIA
jgi:acyl-CoA thioesterase-1